MEFDFSKLLGRMRELDESQRSLADALMIDKSTLNLKLNNRYAFTAYEIIRICDFLEIPYSQIPQYFFRRMPRKSRAAHNGGPT